MKHRKQKNKTDSPLAVEKIIEKRISTNRETHLLFLDPQKAKTLIELYKNCKIKITMRKRTFLGFLMLKGYYVSPKMFKNYTHYMS